MGFLTCCYRPKQDISKFSEIHQFFLIPKKQFKLCKIFYGVAATLVQLNNIALFDLRYS